jgi:hypothetical protein
MRENKTVTYKNLRKGQKIQGHCKNNCESLYEAIVIETNPSYVTILMWGRDEEKISSDNLFYIELAEKEFNDKYRDKAREVLLHLKNKLNHDEIGYHEMWNAWCYGTPYEIAKHCINNNFEVIGYCSDIIPKTSMFSEDELNVGICAEYENGERFWCHYKYSDIERMFNEYKSLLE